MSPRPYRLGQRQAATDQTRVKILEAARALLAGSEGFAAFTIEAVARQSGVARMTVYYQFESKRGLLEALFDDLAIRGQIERVRDSFTLSDPLEGIVALCAAYGHFWTMDRLVVRRLHALGALDPEVEQGLRDRQERRREAMRVMVRRVHERYGRPAPELMDETIDVLFAITGFETFDILAGPSRSPEEVVPMIQKLVKAALGLS